MLSNILHLARRTDRKKLLDKELKNQQIDHYYYWTGQGTGDPVSDIVHGHKVIVDWASRHQLPSVLIAEDGLAFTAPDAFTYFLQHIPTDFDLYLGGVSAGQIRPDHSVIDFCGTVLYLIHECFYKTFLSTAEELNIDRALADKGRYIVW